MDTIRPAPHCLRTPQLAEQIPVPDHDTDRPESVFSRISAPNGRVTPENMSSAVS